MRLFYLFKDYPKEVFIKSSRNAFLSLIILFPFFAVAEAQQFIEIERNHENNPHIFGPTWNYTWVHRSTETSIEFTNKVEVEFSVNVDCGTSRGFMEWPQVSCEQPYLRFRAYLHDAFVKIGDVRLDAENYKTNVRPYEMGKKIYKEMLLVDDPVLYLNITNPSGRNMGPVPHEVNLQFNEFREHAEGYVSTVEQRFSDIQEREVKSWLLHAVAWAVGVLLSMFVLYKLSKNILPIFKKIRGASSALIERRRDNNFDMTVRRAAIDEAVRQLTRREVDEAMYKDKEDVMHLIRAALERDDFETAKALSIKLKKDFRSSKGE